MPFDTFALQAQKLARRLEPWDVKLKYWHALWHVGTFIGTLPRKIKSWYAFGTLARKHIGPSTTFGRRHA